MHAVAEALLYRVHSQSGGPRQLGAEAAWITQQAIYQNFGSSAKTCPCVSKPAARNTQRREQRSPVFFSRRPAWDTHSLQPCPAPGSRYATSLSVPANSKISSCKGCSGNGQSSSSEHSPR